MMVTRETCRVCGSKMEDVLSLGDIVPVDFIRPTEVIRDSAPLTLCECGTCGLVQLRHTVERDTLFRQYWYQSGLNPSMVASLRDVVEGVRARASLAPGDVVVDVGANDGTLLGLYDETLCKVGFDPARNLNEAAVAACDRFINDYFETSDVELPPVKVLTSIAMFYDLDEPRVFVKRVREILREDGIWVMQMTDLVRMLRANAVDNICHEHLCYYSLAIFSKLVEEYGLVVFDVEFNDVNGGSIRAYVGWRSAHEVLPSINEALADETVYLADGALQRFAARVEDAKRKVVAFVRQEIAAGKVFHALGASTKGNTLLQYFGLTGDDIVLAAEVNPDKLGLLMAGSEVPIVSQAESLAIKPDYYLVLPWHFLDFFIRKHADYIANGGVLFTPLPEPMLHGTDARRL